MPKFNEKDLVINIRVNSHMYQRFDEACKRVGVTHSRMIRLLIDDWSHRQYISYCKDIMFNGDSTNEND